MKIWISCIVVALFIGCTREAPNAKQAAAFIEGFLERTGKGNFDNLSDYYSEEMKFGESDEVRKEKMDRLYTVMGPVQKYELLETQSDDDWETPTVTLVYKVYHTSIVSIETYTVKVERSGYKILRQNVESAK